MMRLSMAAMTVCTAVAAGGALAHDGMHRPKTMTPAQKAAFDRHDNFEKLGKLFGAFGTEIRKDKPDLKAVKANAAEIDRLAQALPRWFPKGSGVEARPQSAVKPEVWTDTTAFTAAATEFRTHAAGLNKAAQAGDLNTLRTNFGSLSGACKGCHDRFRAPKKS